MKAEGFDGARGSRGAAGAGTGTGVIVVGADGELVGASVAAHRSQCDRVAGFVGDLAGDECVVAVRAMAAELFPDCEIVMPS